MFTRSEVIVLTNTHTHKHTPLKTSNALRYATTLGNDELSQWRRRRQHQPEGRRIKCLGL